MKQDNLNKVFELLQLVEEEAAQVSIYTDAPEAVEEFRRSVTKRILKRIESDLKEKTDKGKPT